MAVVALVASLCDGHTWTTQWTPEGWTTCLGAGLSEGHIGGQSVCGDVFLLDSQARKEPEAYRQVLRAEWFAEVLGEEEADGMIPGSGGFWQSVAYQQRQNIAAKAEVPALREAEPTAQIRVQAEDEKIIVAKTGVITIPVGACVRTDPDADTVLFMRGPSGGLQMHLPRH